MRCDECRAMILADETSDALVGHLQGCAACRAEQPALEAERSLLMDPTLWEEPSPELAGQIVTLMSGRTPKDQVSRARVPLWTLAAAVLVAVAGVAAFFRLAAPDWEVVLPGTDLAPRAIGSVAGWNTESGTRMVLEVDGLPPAPDGYVYEFWLSEGPLHISAGTFTSAERVELWSGVTRKDFPRLWVTLEPLDEDESPTRNTVLDTG